MSKNSYTESQIRQMVEKISLVAQKNAGLIKIQRLEDAGALAAYIAGYSSWKQYRRAQKEKKAKLHQEVKVLPMPDFSASHIDISSQQILGFKQLLQQSQKHSLQSSELLENKHLISSLVVGERKNSITKSKEVFNLHFQSTLFMGEDTSFLNSLSYQLKEQQQCVIEIFSNKDKVDKEFKLDPLNEIYFSENFDTIFDIQVQNHKEFSFLWSMIIKQLAQQYYLKFTAEFLLQSLELDFLSRLWVLLNHDNHFLANMLGDYLKSLNSVNLQANQVYISASAEKNHWNNSVAIRQKLLILQEAYRNNIFSYKSTGLLNALMNKKSIQLFLPAKSESFVYHTFNLVLEHCFNIYDKKVEGTDIKHQMLFVLNYNEFVLKNNLNSDYILHFCQAYPYQNYLLKEFEQIVFTKHLSFHELDNEFISKFYLQTKKIENNILAHSGEALSELNTQEAYLWQKTDKNEKEHSGNYELNKIFAIHNG